MSTEQVQTEEKQFEDVAETLYSTEDQPAEDTQEATEEKTTDSEAQETEEQATSEEKTEEVEGDDAQEDTQVEEYELEASKDSLLKSEDVATIQEFAKEHNLTKDQATSLLQKQEGILNTFVEAQQKQVTDTLEGWRQEVINDPTLGGENLQQTSEDAKRAVTAYGSEKFTDMLRDSGYGDHPEVVKFLSNIGRNMRDDELIMPGNKSAPQPIENLFYGDDN